jgi:hypothetical protein
MPHRFEMILTLAAAVAAVLAAAEQAPPAIHAGPVYTSLTEFPQMKVLVDVPPSATKATVQPDSFALRVESGQTWPGTQVQTLADSGYGMAAVVMLDVSGSMVGGPLNAIRAGLVKFASQVGLQDKAAIATVADDTRWDTNWNDSPDQVRLALANLKTRGTLTRLWDGLLEALAKYPETPIARRLVVISDGHDEGSQHTLDEVIAAAAKQQVVIDSIGLTRSDPKFLANLARLSSTTGGLHRVALSLTMLEKLVGDGIDRYRGMPVVTFRAQGVNADGKAHPFVVTWKGSGAELQAQIEAQVPGEPAPAAAQTPADPAPTDVPVTAPPPASKVDQVRQKLQEVPRLWWMIGGGALAVLLLGLIVFLVMRKGKGKPKGGTPAKPQGAQPQPGFQPPQTLQQSPQYQGQPPTYQQPRPPQHEFFQPSGPAMPSGSFGQAPPPPAFGSNPFAPPQQPSPFVGGSTYMPLPPDPAPRPMPVPVPGPEPIPSRASEPRFQTPSKGNPSAWLVCTEGPAAGRSYPIDEAQFWIGANANNHLQLADDPTVSGNHSCIAFEHGTLGIYDHQSTNGMYLNDERLTEGRRLLRPGDRLRVGRSTFVLQPASDNRGT